MAWDYKRNFKFLANVGKKQHTFYCLVGGTSFSEASMNLFEFVLSLVFFFFNLYARNYVVSEPQLT